MNQSFIFSTIVDSYVNNKRFLPRTWLAQEIKERLNQPHARFVLFTAEPGMGKSTFMAQLAHDNPTWLRYFIRRDQVSGVSSVGTRPFLMRLGLQLAQLHPDLIDAQGQNIHVQQEVDHAAQGSELLGISGATLTASPFYQQIQLKVSQTVNKQSGGQMTGIQIDTLITDPMLLPLEELQKIALFKPARKLAKTGNKQLVILIDALDELRYSRSKDDILEWLIGINADDWPDNIRFVLSSRAPDARLARFMNKQAESLALLRLDQQKGGEKARFQAQLDADSSRYVENLLGDERLTLDQYWTTTRTAKAWAQMTVRKAEGNIGYIAMIARGLDSAIAQGETVQVLELLDLAELPDELQGLYVFFLNQIKFATMQERLERYDQETGDLFYVNSWSAVYRRLLSVLAVAFEPLTETQWHTLSNVQADRKETQKAIARLMPFLDEENGRYRFYHATLPEFLIDSGLDNVQDTAGFYTHPTLWHQRIAAYYQQFTGKGEAYEDKYGFRYLPAHLNECKQNQAIETLLLNYDWLQAKLIHTNVNTLLQDFDYLANQDQQTPVWLLHSALELARDTLDIDKTQLASQLMGRIQSVEFDEIQKLVTQAKTWSKARWMKPLQATLSTPGGALLQKYRAHMNFIKTMTLTPDGQHLITGSNEAALKVWNIETGEHISTLDGHTKTVYSIAATKDNRLISASIDNSLKVWQINSGELISTTKTSRTYALEDLQLSEDETKVIGRTVFDSNVVVVDLVKNKMLQTIPLKTSSLAMTVNWDCLVYGLRYSPIPEDAVKIAGGRAFLVENTNPRKDIRPLFESLVVRNLKTGQENHFIKDKKHKNSKSNWKPHLLAITPDGKRLLSTHVGRIAVWDIENRKQIAAMKGFRTNIDELLLTPDGKYAVAASRGIIVFWSLENFKSIGWISTQVSVSRILITPDGQRLITGGEDGMIRIWDIEKILDKSKSTPPKHQSEVTSIKITPNGKYAISGAWDGTIKIWALKDGQLVKTLIGEKRHKSPITTISPPSNTKVISISRRYEFKEWGLEDFDELNMHTVEEQHNLAAWTSLSNGKRALIGNFRGELKLWDIVKNQPMQTLREGDKVDPLTAAIHGEHHTAFYIEAVAVTPDENFAIVAIGNRNSLELWDLEKYEKIKLLEGHQEITLTGRMSGVYDVAISPDGKYAVSGGVDQTVRIWENFESNEMQLHTLRGHKGKVGAVVVSQNGRFIISCAADRTIKAWDFETKQEITTFYGDHPFTSLAIGPDNQTIVAGDKTGRVHFLRLQLMASP